MCPCLDLGSLKRRLSYGEVVGAGPHPVRSGSSREEEVRPQAGAVTTPRGPREEAAAAGPGETPRKGSAPHHLDRSRQPPAPEENGRPLLKPRCPWPSVGPARVRCPLPAARS